MLDGVALNDGLGGEFMSEKAYEVIKLVLNGATFSEADKKLGYCKNGARAAFQRWIRKANPELYDAGLRPGEYDNHETPPLSYLREHKEEFLKRPYLNGETTNTAKKSDIEKAILLLIENGYRVGKLHS